MEKTFLWAIPLWITPNYFTIARLGLIPIILVLFLLHLEWAGVSVFFLAAATDVLDGTLARVRDQRSNLGKILDPVADKLLVGVMLFSVGFDYLVTKVLLIAIGIEVLLLLAGVVLDRNMRASVPPSNVFGKLKMAFQTGGVLLFLIGNLAGIRPLADAASYLLWVSLAFVALSAIGQLHARSRKASARTHV